MRTLLCGSLVLAILGLCRAGRSEPSTPLSRAIVATMQAEEELEVNEAEPPQAFTPGLIDELIALRAELKRLRELLERKPATPADPDQPPPRPEPEDPIAEPATPAPPPVAVPAPVPGTTISEGLDADTKWVWALLTERCASCHSGAAAKGGFVLFAEDKVTHQPLTGAKLVLMDQVFYANEMPKSPMPKLDAKAYNRFRAFMQAYTSQIRRAARAADGR